LFKRLLGRLLDAPGLVWASLAFLFILGLGTYRGLRVDLFPPLNFPTLNVITEVPSFSSLQMERQVTLPIESAAGGVLGVRRVRSTSATGISMVSVEFDWGTDMLTARQLLMESLSQVRGQLPGEAEPVIENLSATLAMIEGYSIRYRDGRGDLVKLRDLAVYDLKPRLQRLPGVYKVVVVGGKVFEYGVSPNPYLMIKYGLTLDDLRSALADNNILASPGVVNQHSQELVLHTNGQFADAGEIGAAVVTVKNGQPVRVKDVAQVSGAFQYERGDTSENGVPSVLVNVYKQPSFDTEAVAAAVRGEIGRFSQSLPAGLSVYNYYDQAQLVHDSLASVKESIWVGALLVVLVLALFLREARTTVIAACSIPISVFAAVVLMRAFGIGLNIMSLGGLAIGTAVIVDDAVVVVENIFRWLAAPELSNGRTVRQVVLEATAEVVKPVVVSTLTNIGIFAPMFLVAGFAGRLFAPLSGAVTFALVASLVVSLTVIPVLADQWLSGRAPAQAEAEGALQRCYRRPLQFALRRPQAVLLAALVPLILVALALRRMDAAFLPALDEGSVLIQTVLPPGVSLPESRRFNLKLENWVKQVPGVLTAVRRTGHAPGAEDTDNVNHSDIMIKLEPKSRRPVPLARFIDALAEKTAALPGAQVNYLMPLADKINDALGGVPADLGVDLYGPDLDVLHRDADRLTHALERIPGIADLRPPSDIPVPSLEAQVDKVEAGRLGITERAIHDTLQAYSMGLAATNIRLAQKEIGVVLHFAPAGQDLDLEAVRSLPLRTAGGSTVPLEQVARLSLGEIPSEIYHQHLNRKITVTANIRGRRARDVAGDVSAAVAALKLPAGYSWGFSGKYEAEEAAMGNMLLVLALAVSVVALILWLEFRSVVQVFLVLLTLPLAAVGAVLSLWLFHETLNVSSMAGAVLLVGIVVKNGILLLDCMNRQLEQGAALPDAIAGAAAKRVRPILMTAGVTILGLAPLASGWGTGSELQRPLAIAVIGGLLTSTLLTLVVLPAAASLLLRRGPGPHD
jgi:CzcA family heavy metal efflux pump